MPKSIVLVEKIQSMAPVAGDAEVEPREGAPRLVSVKLAGGQEAVLDVAEERSRVWADVLESRRESDRPVYLEIDADTNAITNLLLPRSVTVDQLTPLPSGDIEVRLTVSAGRHVLRRESPAFEELRAALQGARDQGSWLLVTETGAHEIIDVRPVPPPAAAPAPPAPAPPGMETAMMPDRAVELFGICSAQTCDPLTATAPCIPFLYPDDGCWGRAHEMCRLMQAEGEAPAKIWIYGSLDVRSGNKPYVAPWSPACHVGWGWHVAPTVLVATPGGDERFVIDPSLFTEPVRLEHWKSVQGDPAAALIPSGAAVFYRDESGLDVRYDDAAYTQTNIVLQDYRDELKLRAVTHGVPPYNVCQADVYIRDNLQDAGAGVTVSISASPDINHFRQELNDPQGTLGTPAAQGQDTLFETIEIGQTNYIYLRLQNRGDSAAPVDIDVYYSRASTLPTPTGWNFIGALSTPPVVPGEFRVVGPLTWSTVPAAGHYCFVAVLGTASDPKPSLSSIHTINEFYDFVRNNNNVTWKNFDTIDAFAGSEHAFEFWIQGWPRIAYRSDLEIDRSGLPASCTVQLEILKRLVRGADISGLTQVGESARHVVFDVAAAGLAAICNMPLQTSDRSQATLTVTLPDGLPDGGYQFSVLQRIDGREVGRLTKRLLVGQYPYVTNRNSGEVHLANCDWVHKMSPRNRAACRDLNEARRRGYNGCYFCLPEYDTGESEPAGG